jgi:hypothetical protein
MAAVDVSRVVALTNKALTLTGKGHFARAAEIYAEAVTAAQALHQPDCIIVAQLQASHASALLAHANTAGVPEARGVELTRCAYLELLPAAMASLERRMANGTLLAGVCRPHEVAWCAAKTAHNAALAATYYTCDSQTQKCVCHPPQKSCRRGRRTLATMHTLSLHR